MASPFHARHVSEGNPLGFGMGKVWGEGGVVTESRRLRKPGLSPAREDHSSPQADFEALRSPLRKAGSQLLESLSSGTKRQSNADGGAADMIVDTVLSRLQPHPRQPSEFRVERELETMNTKILALQQTVASQNIAIQTQRANETALQQEAVELRTQLHAHQSILERYGLAGNAMGSASPLPSAVLVNLGDQVAALNQRIEGMHEIIQQVHTDVTSSIDREIHARLATDESVSQRLVNVQRQIADVAVVAASGRAAEAASPTLRSKMHGKIASPGSIGDDFELPTDALGAKLITKASFETSMAAMRSSLQAEIEDTKLQLQRFKGDALGDMEIRCRESCRSIDARISHRMDKLIGALTSAVSDIANELNTSKQSIDTLQSTYAGVQSLASEQFPLLQSMVVQRCEALEANQRTALEEFARRDKLMGDAILKGLQHESQARERDLYTLTKEVQHRIIEASGKWQEFATAVERLRVEALDRSNKTLDSTKALVEASIGALGHRLQEELASSIVSKEMGNMQRQFATQQAAITEFRKVLDSEVDGIQKKQQEFSMNVDAAISTLTEEVVSQAHAIRALKDAHATGVPEMPELVPLKPNDDVAAFTAQIKSHEDSIQTIEKKLAEHAASLSTHDEVLADTAGQVSVNVLSQKAVTDAVSELSIRLEALQAVVAPKDGSPPPSPPAEPATASGNQIAEQLDAHATFIKVIEDELKEHSATLQAQQQTLHVLSQAVTHKPGVATVAEQGRATPSADVAALKNLEARLDGHTELLAETVTQDDLSELQEEMLKHVQQLTDQMQSMRDDMMAVQQDSTDNHEKTIQFCDDSAQRLAAACGKELELAAQAINDLSDYAEVARCTRFLVDTVADAYLSEMTSDIAQDVALQAVQVMASSVHGSAIPLDAFGTPNVRAGKDLLAAASPVRPLTGNLGDRPSDSRFGKRKQSARASSVAGFVS